ncbi:hypothetical protein BpHYR1_054357 [Brachionus plicatilis]|uniref:Uncharacterized protein n=1 Tax=Brachionus plicatilis TaxID=10195 RepID=A0A3M7RDR8_BRAPC|nr:hypothetical protein BpHYR1_054357 [Brachionus plicatilis]
MKRKFYETEREKIVTADLIGLNRIIFGVIEAYPEILKIFSYILEHVLNRIVEIRSSYHKPKVKI